MADVAFGPGHVIEGKYRLTTKLGEGGMGAVWRADHLTLNAPVAVKLLDSSIASTEEGLARFMREAQSAAALRGAHVVQTFDYGVSDGVPFIVMELLVGDSLAERLESKGPMSWASMGKLLKQIARAMHKAHQAGIVHRDLKPDNIFLVEGEDDEPVAKVLDFGIAKSNVSLGLSSGSKTRTGALLGTPYYMSPEQAQGIREVDYRTDLWALAVITFEALTGKRPFDSEALGDLLVKICTQPVPVPSTVATVPPGFDEWFARAAHREPAERFNSAIEMAKAYEVMLDPNRTSMDSLRSFGTITESPSGLQIAPAGDSLEGSEVAPASRRSAKRDRALVLALAAAALVIVVLLLQRGGSAAASATASSPIAAEPTKAPSPPVVAEAPAPSPPAVPAVAPVTRSPSPADDDETSAGHHAHKASKLVKAVAPAAAPVAKAAASPASTPTPAPTFDPLQMRR